MYPYDNNLSEDGLSIDFQSELELIIHLMRKQYYFMYNIRKL